MAFGKITEILGKKDAGVTQHINVESKKTEVMPSDDNANVTWIMEKDSEGNDAPVQLGQGTVIKGYKIDSVIAENTGEATLLLVSRDDVEYVLKLYHKNKTPKKELLDILADVNSEYIIHSVEQGMYGERFYEVLPYYRGGDLLARMPISEQVITNVIVPGVNEGLKTLHDRDIIHRDIKPGNIFLDDETGKAIIGDFGISSVLNEEVSVRATSMSRTLGYSAPETSNGFISKESDYYSFGITIYHLVLGTDPFAGMSDMQILYQTINKKLEIPQTVSIRLQALIKGLTLKDRNDRWGYNEVSRWCAGEDVGIQDSTLKTDVSKPYNFMKEKYYDLVSLSMAFAQNWDNAKKHLYRGMVDKYLSGQNEEMASQCIELKEITDKDLAVFKLIRLLNPDAPLCYKGRLYNDLETVGNMMAAASPEVDPDIMEMVQNGALLEYVKENRFDDRLKTAVGDITDSLQMGTDDNKYFKLMYTLDPSMGFEVSQVRCEDLGDLIDYLESVNEDERSDIADHLIDNNMFLAWIDAMGYSKQVTEWQGLYEKVEW